jgi:predicted alpha/beta-hydrolase family hydrolase
MRSREPTKPELIFDGPKTAAWKIALAHGAGAGMNTSFKNAFVEGLASAGLRVARFESPYMAAFRRTGLKRPSDREPAIREAWLQAVAMLGRWRLVISGRSMGGRIAIMLSDETGVADLVCQRYPFHPTGNPDQLRVGHLRNLQTPTPERTVAALRVTVLFYFLSTGASPSALHCSHPRTKTLTFG